MCSGSRALFHGFSFLLLLNAAIHCQSGSPVCTRRNEAPEKDWIFKQRNGAIIQRHPCQSLSGKISVPNFSHGLANPR